MKQSEPMKGKVFCYRGGKFTIEPEQAWQKAVVEAGILIKQGRIEVECQEYMEERIDGNYANVSVWETPDGGLFALLVNNQGKCDPVFIPDRADWLPFYASYIAPFIQAQASLRLVNSRIQYLQDFLMEIRNKLS